MIKIATSTKGYFPFSNETAPILCAPRNSQWILKQEYLHETFHINKNML